MARIQILELPSQVVGEIVRAPFALVIDQVDTETINTHSGANVRTLTELTQDEANAMAKSVGAEAAILATFTLDIA